MQQVDGAGSMQAFRMDDRKQRLVVDSAQSDLPGFLGWEVAQAHDLDDLAARLEEASITVEWGSRALAAERCVTQLIVFQDPAGAPPGSLLAAGNRAERRSCRVARSPASRPDPSAWGTSC